MTSPGWTRRHPSSDFRPCSGHAISMFLVGEKASDLPPSLGWWGSGRGEQLACDAGLYLTLTHPLALGTLLPVAAFDSCASSRCTARSGFPGACQRFSFSSAVPVCVHGLRRKNRCFATNLGQEIITNTQRPWSPLLRFLLVPSPPRRVRPRATKAAAPQPWMRLLLAARDVDHIATQEGQEGSATRRRRVNSRRRLKRCESLAVKGLVSCPARILGLQGYHPLKSYLLVALRV